MVAAACILYPIRTSGGALRAISNGTEETLSNALTSGRDYWMSGDGDTDSGEEDLVAYLQTLLNTNTGSTTYTVTVSATTHQVTVSANHPFTLRWGHGATTLDPLVWGFTATDYTSSGDTRTGPNGAMGAWLPGKPCWVTDRERQPLVGGVVAALSGLQRTAVLSVPKKERDLVWRLVPQAKTLREYEAATDPYGSVEEAWLSAIGLGRTWRFYEDASVRTTSSYSLYRTRGLVSPYQVSADVVTSYDVTLQARVA